jgi:N-acetylmuramoyl-L-alanine amidase
MRRRASRLLHVLACAPVAAITAATLAPPAHAQAASQRPLAYVIAIDPGHGGRADDAHPDQPFDPGVIAASGLAEKDVTLDVAHRLQKLLTAQSVKVVMTRDDDRYVGIQTRMQSAIDAGAALFVSIHFNSFTDPATAGSVVLYPGDASLPFAQTMSDTLQRDLSAFGVVSNGIQAKPDLWQHATMPAITVEAAYLTNPREADLCSRPSFRQAVASAVSGGILAQVPGINTRKAEMASWDSAHPGHSGAAAANRALPSAGGGHSVIPLLVVMTIATVLLMHQRRRLVSLAVALGNLPERVTERRPRVRWQTRRRRAARRRALLERSRHTPGRRTVYDELWF